MIPIKNKYKLLIIRPLFYIMCVCHYWLFHDAFGVYMMGIVGIIWAVTDFLEERRIEKLENKS